MSEATTRNGEVAAVPAGGLWKHRLAPLPYDPAALEPHIDARTMLLHHGKHHASYVQKLNALLEPFPELQGKTALWLLLNPGSVPLAIRTVVRHNAGGHVNHSLFWRAMSASGGGAPSGPLAAAVGRDFGSFEIFKARFVEAGAALFGSGWVWLARTRKEGRLEILTTPGHGNPLVEGRFPLLLNDVWEHAYYLKHENLRAGYLDRWWSVVDWREAARRFERSWSPAAGKAAPYPWTKQPF